MCMLIDRVENVKYNMLYINSNYQTMLTPSVSIFSAYKGSGGGGLHGGPLLFYSRILNTLLYNIARDNTRS